MHRGHSQRVGRGPALRRHASAGSRPFCLSCATGVRQSPSTRARAQLLGPCFKTGRTECQEPHDPDPGCRAAPRGETSDTHKRQTASSSSPPAASPPREPLPPKWGGHRGRSSPARSADAAAASNTTRERVATLPPSFRRPDRRSSRSAVAKCTARQRAAEWRRRTRPVPSVCL